MADRAPADRHVPVMRDACISLLSQAAQRLQGPSPVVIDATLGMGGHTAALLEANPTVTVIGIDRDPQALQLAGERLAGYGDRFRSVRAVYDEIGEVAQSLQPGEALAGVLFDLGVSSLQLDEAERGFAYSYDAALDMRMDSSVDSEDPTAAELLDVLAAEH